MKKKVGLFCVLFVSAIVVFVVPETTWAAGGAQGSNSAMRSPTQTGNPSTKKDGGTDAGNPALQGGGGVPEPTTMALVGAGIAALLIARKRKR